MRAWIRIELPVAIAKNSWIRVLDTPSCYECAAPPRGRIEGPCGQRASVRNLGPCEQLRNCQSYVTVIHSNQIILQLLSYRDLSVCRILVFVRQASDLFD